jgi:hypothetical protein
MFYTYIREAPCSNLCLGTGYIDRSFRWYPPSLQSKPGQYPIKLWPLSSESFPSFQSSYHRHWGKGKVKLSLCLTNKHYVMKAHGSGGEWSTSRPGRFTHGERAAGTHRIGSWIDLRAGLDDLEKRTFLILPGLELRSLGRPASS